MRILSGIFKDNMIITYQGDFSFTITTKKGVILINPKNEAEAPKDLIFSIFSSQNSLDNFAGKPSINWPGEYEFQGISIKSFVTREQGLAHAFIIDEVQFGFLGDIKKIISQEKIEPLLNTDVLFLPKTEDGMSNKDLKKLSEEIDPRIMLMAGQSNLFSEVFKEFGAENAETVDQLEVTNSKLPADHTRYVKLQINN